MTSKKYIISAFAMMSAFIIISTAFIHPISVKAGEQLVCNVNSNPDDEFLRSLLKDEDGSLREIIDKILEIGDSRPYTTELYELAAEVLKRDEFDEYVSLISKDYDTQMSRLALQEKPKTREVIKEFNKNEKAFFEGKFEIYIYEKTRTRSLSSIYERIIGKFHFLKNLFNSIFNKYTDKTNDKKTEVLSGPKVIDITFNLDHVDAWGTHTILKNKQISVIFAFYQWLDMFYDVNYVTEPDKYYDKIDFYCNMVIGFSQFTNDDVIYETYLPQIVQDEELKELAKELFSNPGNAEDIADDITAKLDENPAFGQLVNYIKNTWGSDEILEIIIVISIFLLVFVTIPLAVISPLITLNLLYNILAVSLVYVVIHAIGSLILDILELKVPAFLDKIAIVCWAIVIGFYTWLTICCM